MKTHRGPTLVGYLILTGLVLCFSPARLSAGNWQVTFSLPFETHWGGAVLPAGSYTLRLDTFNNGRPMQLEQDVWRIAMVMAQSEETSRTPAKSQLVVAREGKTATVHILYIAELGTAFHFSVPQRYEVYTQLIARADEPTVIERIPVTVSGK